MIRETMTVDQMRIWIKHRKLDAVIDTALIGIASSLGVPMADLLKQVEGERRHQKGFQEIGEFCRRQFIGDCTKQFGDGLWMACRTCPD